MERVLTDFVKALRNSSIRVSPAETLDATEVLEKIGYDNRELLKNTLSITLSKTPEEKSSIENLNVTVVGSNDEPQGVENARRGWWQKLVE